MNRLAVLGFIGAASVALSASTTNIARADDAPRANGKSPLLAAVSPELSGSVSGEPTDESGSAANGKVKDDAAKSDTPTDDKEKTRNPWRGSQFLFDQSVTTNSFDKAAQLSYSPLYEWWLSPRVYYSFSEHVKVGARFDFFKEMFTNHVETTDRGEWVVGDPWLTAGYSDTAKFINNHPLTRWSLNLLVRPPLSKESRANGQYFAAGPGGNFTVGFNVRGPSAKTFQTASLGVSASFSHAFTKSTTPTGFNGFCRPGTGVGGENLACNDQVRSGTTVGDSLIYAANGTLDITKDLGLSLSYIVINQFSYEPGDAYFNGAYVPRNPNDTHFRQLSWALASFDYDVAKEFSVGVGYYNLNTVIGLDGKFSNPLWSPDARVFLSLTAHLDAISDDFQKKRPPSNATANAQKPTMIQ
ncbi:MAG: hypothetical protein NVS3B20_06850 [Polyangiales bacterium]